MRAREVPSHRFGKTGDEAALVGFLASPRASFVTGTVATMAGGQLGLN